MKKKLTNPLLEDQTLSQLVILEENFMNKTAMSVTSVSQLIEIYTVP